MNRIRAFLADRRRVLIAAGIIGAAIGAVAIARRSSSDTPPTDPAAAAVVGAPIPVYDAGAGGAYAVSDPGFSDSTSAATIVEEIATLGGSLGGVQTTIDSIQTAIDELRGVSNTAAADAAAAQQTATSAIQQVQQQATAQPAPQSPSPKPTAGTPAPKPSTPQNVDHFRRDAIAWKSLFLPTVTNGKVTGKKAVKLSELTDAQIQSAIKLDINRGALAAGWTVNKSGQVVRA